MSVNRRMDKQSVVCSQGRIICILRKATFLTSWLDLEDIMLNEINQTEKQIPHNPAFMRNQNSKTQRTREETSGYQELEEGKIERCRSRVQSFSKMNKFWESYSYNMGSTGK